MPLFVTSTIEEFRRQHFINLAEKASDLQTGISAGDDLLKPLQAIYRSFNFSRFNIPLSNETKKMVGALLNGTAYEPPTPPCDPTTQSFPAGLLDTHPLGEALKPKLNQLLQDIVDLSGSGVTLAGLFAASHPSAPASQEGDTSPLSYTL
ncbi:MAG: hypothetical protein P1U40_04920 [Coxiellaceae bacterium]|nr:hypothetical protein [Coxiellaceae bacterium]